MNKATGRVFAVYGKEITAEAAFIAEAAEGEVVVKFAFDAKAITELTTLVVFETIYGDDEIIAEHSDIEDTEQTIIVMPIDEDVPRGDVPPTGVGMDISLLGLAAVAVVIFGRRRKNNK